MNILIAPQSFKESLSGIEVARAIEKGVLAIFPKARTLLLPIADGGDGTLKTLIDATEGNFRSNRVIGLLGERVEAQWGILGDGHTAIIEMAQAAGLALIPSNRKNPFRTTTYGIGQLIAEAIKLGLRKFIICIGGSGTNDGGAGMAQALGARLLDEHGKDLFFGGGPLTDLCSIDISHMLPGLKECKVEVACDVTNPLTGLEGASNIYGPQKGATPAMVKKLDKALLRFAQVVLKDLKVDIDQVPGAGAAGGLGGGLLAFLNPRLRPGADIILDILELNKKLNGVDLIITGEGRIDNQTIYNKAPVAVAMRGKEKGIPTIALCGSLGEGYESVYAHGIESVYAINTSSTKLNDNYQDSARQLSKLAKQVMQFLIT